MPNFNKSKGFQLRSGNKAKAPFKMMGSSPAKDMLSDIFTSKKEKDIKLNSNTPERNLESEAKGKIDKTRGTREGQVKKSGRLDKIQNRQDKRALRKYNNSLSQGSQGEMGMEAFKKSDKYTDKTSKREGRLKKEVNMTPDEYDANQAAKKEKFAQGMRDVGALVSNIGNEDESMSSVIQGQVDKKQKQKDKDIQNEKDKVSTERTQQLVDTYKKENSGEGELAADVPEAATSIKGNTMTNLSKNK